MRAMMRFLSFACMLVLVSCAATQTPPTAPAGAEDAALDAVVKKAVDRYLELSPESATRLGDHRFDGRWSRYDAEGDKTQRAFVADTKAALAKLDSAKLSLPSRIDRAILEDQLDVTLLYLDRLHPWTDDPLFFTVAVGDGLDPLVTRDFAPHAQRMESLRQRLEGLPAFLTAARESLQHPPRVRTETAIQQNEGLVALLEGGLAPDFAKEPAQRAALETAAQKAAAALRDYGTFLKNDLLPRSDGDFRRGEELFKAELRYNLGAAVPAEELYAAAKSVLAKTQDEMLATALELWPELFPGQPKPDPKTHEERMKVVKAALDKLADDRPTNTTIIDEAKKLTDAATAFVRAKNLVGVPDEPLHIIVVPEYRRGVAVAYCDSAGPLEAKKETFVAISPTPSDWPPERVTSFYREYNRAMLAELVVHEAMPGHYLQIAHANQDKSLARSVFGSGAFAEGWAVYGEWLMAKHGFGGPRVRLERQKMLLRVAANAILDHDVHAGQMSREEAMKLMTEQALQEEGEAAGKWKRAQLTSAQLSTYFYGFYEIMKIRERGEKLPGFAERAFNDKLISFGSPPPRFLAPLVFGDPL
jgi:uncharacterized protein (DUF885 family)